MTIEEKIDKLIERCNVSGDSSYIDCDAGMVEELKTICQQEIKQACDKQKVICADAYLKRTVWDIDVGSVIDLIKDAPYPEGVK